MDYIFVTGMGRSGTKFLTSLLHNSNELHSKHEYTGNREFWLLSWYLDSHIYAEPYLHREKSLIDSKFKDKQYFCDINSYLQNSVPSIRKIFKNSHIFHLVRDPRYVIPSLYSRRNDKNIHLIPKNKPEIEQWINADKFWQICWNWASTTEKLISEKTKLIIFEKILTDYDYFESIFLKPLGLTFNEDIWINSVRNKVNKTRSKFFRYFYTKLKNKVYISESLPCYDKWPDTHKKIFKEHCEVTMKKCGYKI